MNKKLNWIELFLNAQYAEYQSSENTILAYKHDLNSFIDFLIKENVTLGTASQKNIENYMIHLDKNGLALFGDSTSATRSGLKKSKFDTLEVNDLKKLSPDTVFKKMTENLKRI